MVQITSAILFSILLVPILANPIPQTGATDIGARDARSLEDIARRAPVVADVHSGGPDVPKAPVAQHKPKNPPKADNAIGSGKTKKTKPKMKTFHPQKPDYEFPI